MKQNYLLLCILLLALVLRLLYLTVGTVQLDEVYTSILAQQSLADILKNRSDPYPPFSNLPYLLWIMVFGISELSWEMFSVVFGVLSVGAIYFVAAKLVDERTGIYSALLLAVSTYHLHISQQIRIYSFSFFVGLLTCFYLIEFLQRPNARKLLPFFAAALLFMNTHYFTLLVTGYFLVFAFFICRKEGRMSKGLCLTALALALCYLPVLLYLLEQYFSLKTFTWIPAPTIKMIHATWYHMSSQSEILTKVFLALIIYAGITTRHYKLDEEKYWFLIGWLIVPMTIAYAASSLGSSFFHLRYFIYVFPAYIILSANGISLIPQRWLRVFLIALIVVPTALTLNRYYLVRQGTGAQKLQHHHIEINWREGDVVVHTTKCSYVQTLFYDHKGSEHYLIRGGGGINVIKRLMDHKVYITPRELSAYTRIWFFAVNCSSGLRIEKLLSNPNIRSRSLEETHLFTNGKLVLVE